MRLCQTSGYRHPQARAAALLQACIGLLKSFKHHVLILKRDPWPRVADSDDDLVIALLSADFDFALIREFAGIRHDIEQHLINALSIARNQRQILIEGSYDR